MKKINLALFLFLLSSSLAYSKEYKFIFGGFTEKNIRIKWEVYTNSPAGFNEDNEFTYKQGEGYFTANLKKGQKIRFEAYALENSRIRSLIETRTRDQLNKRERNSIIFSIYQKKDPKELLSLPQMMIKVSQEEFASGLLKEEDEMIIDTDLPTGTLIFFDGEKSYYRPTTGIIDREVVDEQLNQYNHRLSDMIKIEQNLTIGASTSQLGFLKKLSVGVDLNNSKFFEYKVEINNLSKRQANTYLTDPFDIFNNTNDRWLEAAYSVINRSNSKSKYKLYFVSSRTLSDQVYISRRIYKEFKGDISLLVDGGSLIEVEGGAKHYSLAKFEKLDSIRNYYVNYEVIDMSMVMLNEASKYLAALQVDAVRAEKVRVEEQIEESKSRLKENYDLLKLYSDLPQTITSSNQVISICSHRNTELEKAYELDSLGNEIANTEIDQFNRRIREYNNYLGIIKDEINNYYDLVELKEAIITRLWKIENNLTTEPTEPERKPKNLEAKVVADIRRGAPE